MVVDGILDIRDVVQCNNVLEKTIMTRDRTILINGGLLAQLRLLAELDGLDCQETALELIVRTALDARPEIAERAQMRADAVKAADKAWRDKHRPKADAYEADNAMLDKWRASEAAKAANHKRIAETKP